MPAYNEEANIKNVVEDWYPILKGKHPDSRLVIADSKCTDKTHEVLESLLEGHPQLEIFTDCEKTHGAKVIALYKHAINRNAEFVFQTDSDGQTNPEEFNAFWELRRQYDAIIGNRTERGDGQDRAFVEKVVCFMLRVFFGVKVPDANAPFRLINTNILRKYINKFDPEYALPNIMLTAFFAYNKENITFRKISFKPRAAGENSINIKKIIGFGTQSIKDFMKFRKDMGPSIG
jgi:glycosyltransferase involved in cell wall biosynthesis